MITVSFLTVIGLPGIMVTRTIGQMTTRLSLPLLVSALALGPWNGCLAQSSSGWSFWGAGDGMKESYTSSVAVQARRVWIKHGSVSGMNLLDGYGISERSDLGETGKLLSAPEGTLWCWAGQRLSRYRNSRWDSFGVERVTS